MIARRAPRLTGILIPALLFLCWSARATLAQPLLDARSHPKFENPLPLPARVDDTGGGRYRVDMTQFRQHLGLVDPVTNQRLMTTVRGYDRSYPGPTFVARKDVPVDFLWMNELVGKDGDRLPHLLPVDVSLHWADPGGWPGSGVPTVTHLHGGYTESASDGLPEAWFTPRFALTGSDFVKELYHYDNDQEAATLWYHDHALGITRLNVYAGLAGFYLLRDDNEMALIERGCLPGGPYEIEIVIQDRMFDTRGELFYPSEPPVPGAPDPSVLPEFFGDFILVNGAAWPILELEPREYRYRFLNGSDSRFYSMWLVEGDEWDDADDAEENDPREWMRAAKGLKHGDRRFEDRDDDAPVIVQIGTDDGFLKHPVRLERLLLGPGERADVVIDFSDDDFREETFILRNDARSPYPNGDPVDPLTAGQIMAFRVCKRLDRSYSKTSLAGNLRPLHGPIRPLEQTGATRELVLLEQEDEYGRLRPQLGTASAGALLWDDAITENPMLDDVEVWTVFNATPDAHPIHLHLVAFQILDHQKFTADVDPATGAPSNIRHLGEAKKPGRSERGWKDTAVMYPGEVTRVSARFDRKGLYVWHCHILSHEDHEMMRPYYVGPEPTEPLASLVSPQETAGLPVRSSWRRIRPTPSTRRRRSASACLVPGASSSRSTTCWAAWSGPWPRVTIRRAIIRSFSTDGTTPAAGCLAASTSTVSMPPGSSWNGRW